MLALRSRGGLVKGLRRRLVRRGVLLLKPSRMALTDTRFRLMEVQIAQIRSHLKYDLETS
jgi:hypothetical protein